MPWDAFCQKMKIFSHIPFILCPVCMKQRNQTDSGVICFLGDVLLCVLLQPLSLLHLKLHLCISFMLAQDKN